MTLKIPWSVGPIELVDASADRLLVRTAEGLCAAGAAGWENRSVVVPAGDLAHRLDDGRVVVQVGEQSVAWDGAGCSDLPDRTRVLATRGEESVLVHFAEHSGITHQIGARRVALDVPDFVEPLLITNGGRLGMIEDTRIVLALHSELVVVDKATCRVARRAEMAGLVSGLQPCRDRLLVWVDALNGEDFVLELRPEDLVAQRRVTWPPSLGSALFALVLPDGSLVCRDGDGWKLGLVSNIWHPRVENRWVALDWDRRPPEALVDVHPPCPHFPEAMALPYQNGVVVPSRCGGWLWVEVERGHVQDELLLIERTA